MADNDKNNRFSNGASDGDGGLDLLTQSLKMNEVFSNINSNLDELSKKYLTSVNDVSKQANAQTQLMGTINSTIKEVGAMIVSSISDAIKSYEDNLATIGSLSSISSQSEYRDQLYSLRSDIYAANLETTANYNDVLTSLSTLMSAGITGTSSNTLALYDSISDKLSPDFSFTSDYVLEGIRLYSEEVAIGSLAIETQLLAELNEKYDNTLYVQSGMNTTVLGLYDSLLTMVDSDAERLELEQTISSNTALIYDNLTTEAVTSISDAVASLTSADLSNLNNLSLAAMASSGVSLYDLMYGTNTAENTTTLLASTLSVLEGYSTQVDGNMYMAGVISQMLVGDDSLKEALASGDTEDLAEMLTSGDYSTYDEVEAQFDATVDNTTALTTLSEKIENLTDNLTSSLGITFGELGTDSTGIFSTLTSLGTSVLGISAVSSLFSGSGSSLLSSVSSGISNAASSGILGKLAGVGGIIATGADAYTATSNSLYGDSVLGNILGGALLGTNEESVWGNIGTNALKGAALGSFGGLAGTLIGGLAGAVLGGIGSSIMGSDSIANTNSSTTTATTSVDSSESIYDNTTRVVAKLDDVYSMLSSIYVKISSSSFSMS